MKRCRRECPKLKPISRTTSSNSHFKRWNPDRCRMSDRFAGSRRTITNDSSIVPRVSPFHERIPLVAVLGHLHFEKILARLTDIESGAAMHLVVVIGKGEYIVFQFTAKFTGRHPHGVPPVHNVAPARRIPAEHAMPAEAHHTISFLAIVLKHNQAVKREAVVYTADSRSPFRIPGRRGNALF